MTFDGITSRAVVRELQDKIVGGRINRIRQLGNKQLGLQIYAQGQNQLLFISANSSSARFHLSFRDYETPPAPSNFIMVLRKYLGHGRLDAVEQIGLDRTVRLSFTCKDELGYDRELYLMVEVMGKYSNLILLDEQQRVIDAIQRVSHEMSRVRQVFPGSPYVLYPSDKKEILEEDVSLPDLLSQSPPNSKLRNIFYKKLTGFSPTLAREIAFEAGLDPEGPISLLSPLDIERLDQVFQKLVDRIRRADFQPSLYLGSQKNFYPLPLHYLGQADQTDPSISYIIDSYTEKTGRIDRIGQMKKGLQDTLSHALEKEERTLYRMERDLEKTRDREKIREEGDILAASVPRLKKGMEEIVLPDFYHENEPRTIALDPRREGWENVEAKYKKASKLKQSYKMLNLRLPRLKSEIAYLNQLAYMLEEAESSELIHEIQDEFMKEGLIQRPGRKRSKQKQTKASRPLEYMTKNGFSILVGQNNRQNDQLTLKTAAREDYFFHARIIPGAHVILRTNGRQPQKEDIEAAAWLAATHSSNKNDHTVDVDFTQKKNVYKAKGAKPGMVYYNDFQTLTVNTLAEVELEEK